jgi:hypothetical protein
VSDFTDEEAKERGRARARSTAVWDSRLCDRGYWDYLMTIIPHDAIGADMTKQALYNSYGPKAWYRNEQFKCKDCGRNEVWTAEQQRWWFEVAKGQINSRAIRCRACRKAWREKTGRVSHAERQKRKKDSGHG